MEDPFEAINSARKLLLSKVVNPLDAEFSQLVSKIAEFDGILLDAQKIAYYCSNCRKKHTPKTPSQKYQDHRLFSQILYKFPPLHTELFLQVHKMQIVGIYYANSADYLNSLPGDATLELRTEPNNPHDRYAVAVFHQEQKLGYLTRGPNQIIFHAIQQNKSIQCVFNRFYPAHFENGARRHRWSDQNEYFPDRGNIIITVYDFQKIDLALHNLIELENLGHPEVIPLFRSLGPLVIQKLSSWEECEANPKITQTLNRLALEYQIEIKKSDLNTSSFTVIL